MKKIPIFVFLLLVVLLGACGDPVADELERYVNEDLEAIADMEEEAINSYNQISAGDFASDEEIYVFLQEEVLPMYLDFIDELEAITFENSEVRDLHEIYVDAVNTQHSAMLKTLAAIEEQNYEKISEANELLAEGRKGIRDFQMELEALMDEHDLEWEEE
ncbi:hypothetical protein [Ornithinibacillus halophilus]|uniref:Cell-wall binding lipoprotein n=1 Tax=Ornithinibacillus halophilus TaxID=930117 RepID=A0A1M5NML2_9BACI|nr:hypothetical protein [Ornithinibacillus halophilus]SHG90824.1 hypothetical protein SAMN05216225_10852 [Ornithinibacillus halophilus]